MNANAVNANSLAVSLSNREPRGSSFDRLRMSVSFFVLLAALLGGAPQPRGQTRAVKALVGGTLIDGNGSHRSRTASSSSTAIASAPSARSARCRSRRARR